MALYTFEGKCPAIDSTAWIAPSADIIGDVQIGPKCYIGWGAVLRGDHGSIIIKEGSAIEEGAIIHNSPDLTTRIGPEATIGHGAMLHNATVEAFAVIGMRAVLSNHSRIGEWAIIGEMGLVRNNQEVAAGMIGVGQPVKVIGKVTQHHKERWITSKKRYQGFIKRNNESLNKI